MTQPKETLDLDFSHLEFFDTYVISRLKEDMVMDIEKLHILIEVCSNFYGNQPYVYISKRENNYNVNPTIYLKLDDLKNLCGIAIVSQRSSSLNMANFEKNFSRVPFEVFLELDEAIAWSEKQVENKKADL